jgi:hypothetical protein
MMMMVEEEEEEEGFSKIILWESRTLPKIICLTVEILMEIRLTICCRLIVLWK